MGTFPFIQGGKTSGGISINLLITFLFRLDFSQYGKVISVKTNIAEACCCALCSQVQVNKAGCVERLLLERMKLINAVLGAYEKILAGSYFRDLKTLFPLQ